MTAKLSHSDQAVDIANRRAYARRYYQANKDKARTYYQVNKEKIKARSKAWRQANRKRYLKQQSTYYCNVRTAKQWHEACGRLREQGKND